MRIYSTPHSLFRYVLSNEVHIQPALPIYGLVKKKTTSICPVSRSTYPLLISNLHICHPVHYCVLAFRLFRRPIDRRSFYSFQLQLLRLLHQLRQTQLLAPSQIRLIFANPLSAGNPACLVSGTPLFAKPPERGPVVLMGVGEVGITAVIGPELLAGYVVDKRFVEFHF